MSDRKKQSVQRRDERNTIVPNIRTPSGSKRNTKKWCRGVVGREHQPECRSYNELKNVTYANQWKVLICKICHKELDHYWPVPWMKQQPKPKWVVD